MTWWIRTARSLLLWALDRELQAQRRLLYMAERRFHDAYEDGDVHALADRRQDVLTIQGTIRDLEDEEVRVRPRE